ncbi:hypothetical protein PCL_07928 [Purpureocillium lilacinum]|nr:hypothetical protein PCL_07928 [Purpureocillium lilacinum]
MAHGSSPNPTSQSHIRHPTSMPFLLPLSWILMDGQMDGCSAPPAPLPWRLPHARTYARTSNQRPPILPVPVVPKRALSWLAADLANHGASPRRRQPAKSVILKRDRRSSPWMPRLISIYILGNDTCAVPHMRTSGMYESDGVL